MTMSCCSIIDKFDDMDCTESEKDVLMKRLCQLLEAERQQISNQIVTREKQLLELENDHNCSKKAIQISHEKEMELMLRRHSQEKETLQQKHADEERRILLEISKLETDLQNLTAPSQLLSTLQSGSGSCCRTPTDRSSSCQSRSQGVNDLEHELECCVCHNLCTPPSKVKIF